MNRLAALLIALTFAVSARAENWPAWRGPTGQGYSSEKNLPTEWSEKKNVKWKASLASQSNSTPIVWGDKIFLTLANKGGNVRSLICLARADGKQLWKVDVDYKGKERNWDQNWYANASPATDGERVVVSFGSAGVWCYDMAGKELWNRTDLGTWEHQFGNGSSPIFYENTVIQWCGPNDPKGRNFLVAMDKKTGSTKWEQDESYGSWTTPLVVKVGGKDQMLLGYSPDAKGAKTTPKSHFKGYDPKSGKELWDCGGLDSFVYTTPLVKDDIAVQMCGYNGAAIAVKLGGEGDITKDRLWRHPKNVQRVGSGIIVGDHVYQVEDDGAAHCYELKSGKEVWKADKLGEGSWGSMVHADGRLYLLNKAGESYVFAANPKYELLATNSLGRGERSNSSIAISDGDIFVRTFKHLWCIHAAK